MRFLGLAATAAILLGCSTTAMADDPATMSSLEWLSGSWESAEGENWTEEHWLPARGQLMLGMGRSGAGDTARSFEYLRIQPGADGTLIYLAAPGGGTATGFALVSSGDQSAVFENPDHDYPQRIRYWREGDVLHAEIALIDGSNAYSWSLRRAD